jgi:hypothetical protein
MDRISEPEECLLLSVQTGRLLVQGSVNHTGYPSFHAELLSTIGLSVGLEWNRVHCYYGHLLASGTSRG